MRVTIHLILYSSPFIANPSLLLLITAAWHCNLCCHKLLLVTPLRKHPEFIKQGRGLIPDLTGQMEITDGFLHGPQIVPLAPQHEFDAGVISAYISRVLRGIKRDNVYGVFAAVKRNSGPPIPTLIFGIPPPTLTPAVLPPAPWGLPTLVRTDFILLTNGFQTLWDTEPVHDVGAITLTSVSIGIEGSLVTAGSFGGFLRRPSNAYAVFGITAGHCVPGADPGTPLCSPSTLEVTSRFNRLVNYTSLCPPMADHWHVSEDKEREAKWLLAQFRFQEGPSGVEFLDPEDGFRLKKGVLLGRRVGHIVDYRFGQQQNLLYDYDQRLRVLGLPTFSAEPGWAMRTDWSIFVCVSNRYGGNTYDGVLVPETGDLYPCVEVEKIGRSTGAKHGQVNGYHLQYWTGGQESYEVAIASTGRGMVFADVGDSGGCVFAKENGVSKAAGILIGKNNLDDLFLATPLNIILRLAPAYRWA